MVDEDNKPVTKGDIKHLVSKYESLSDQLKRLETIIISSGSAMSSIQQTPQKETQEVQMIEHSEQSAMDSSGNKHKWREYHLVGP